MTEKIRNFKAAIFDMDGVITQTASLHAKAWKLVFDDLLQMQAGKNYRPLDIEEDYKKYIDGKPRLDGVRSFLDSRGIVVPEGQAGEDAGAVTVYSLGARKNEYFQKILKEEGIHVFPDTLKLLNHWRKQGLKLAVISSSRNCEQIMTEGGILDLFDVRVDGLTSEKENLKGKPEPDIFLKASERLEIDVNDIIVLEDAISGVEAAKKGGFAKVIGVARGGHGDALRNAGADIVVKDLSELDQQFGSHEEGNMAEDLPHALDKIDRIFNIMGNKLPALFLDFDGTLSPIVSDPDAAKLPQKTKTIMIKLAEIIPIGVISGRDRRDIEKRLGIENIIYAGSHGFDITGPDDLEMQYEPGLNTLPDLDEAQKHLEIKLKNVRGAQVERKKYAIAVHYRNVAENEVEGLEKVVFEELDQQEKLKKGSGKKVLELKPDLDWHKGRALTWLLKKLELDSAHYIPIFIGDDVTDEDALEAIKDEGIGIIVGSHEQKTYANYRLNSTEEVGLFLEKLNQGLQQRKASK